MISLDLMKSPEVRKAGDRSIYLDHFFYLVLNNFLDKDIGFDTYIMLSICNSYKYVPGYVWFNTCLYFLSLHGTNTMMDFKNVGQAQRIEFKDLFWCSDSVCQKMSVCWGFLISLRWDSFVNGIKPLQQTLIYFEEVNTDIKVVLLQIMLSHLFW